MKKSLPFNSVGKVSEGARVRLGYWLAQKFLYFLFRSLYGLEVRGRENIPASGPFILASNHQSWFDPPLVGCSCPREVAYAAKVELFRHILLGPLVRYFNAVPVKRGGFERQAIQRLGEYLEKGLGVVIFPEGTRFLDGKLRPPKSGVGMLVLKYDVPVVPTFVSGSARIRRQLWRRSLRVSFGEPFRMKDIDTALYPGRDLYDKLAWGIMERVAKVGRVPPPEPLPTHSLNPS